VKRFEELLLAHEVVDAEVVKRIQERIEREFDEGYEFAQASPFPVASDVTRGLWVEDGYWRGEPSREGGTG
jgi:TPP-dependent pyruvate/acetoin dehydrogenase alpha subunit